MNIKGCSDRLYGSIYHICGSIYHIFRSKNRAKDPYTLIPWSLARRNDYKGFLMGYMDLYTISVDPYTISLDPKIGLKIRVLFELMSFGQKA